MTQQFRFFPSPPLFSRFSARKIYGLPIFPGKKRKKEKKFESEARPFPPPPPPPLSRWENGAAVNVRRLAFLFFFFWETEEEINVCRCEEGRARH